MKIKIFLKKSADFALKRFSEIFGLTILIISVGLLVSLISYSPDDPNFLYKGDKSVENLLGVNGSFASDLLFQSFGIISLLVPISLFFTSITIILKKNILCLIDNCFFTILYVAIGTIFFSIYFNESFWLSVNGNGGFLGKFLINLLSFDFIDSTNNFFFYGAIIVISIFFLLSINFKLSIFNKIYLILKNVINKKNNIELNNKILDENLISKHTNETRIQENLPFAKSSDFSEKVFKFKKPNIDLLNSPKKENKNNDKKLDIDNSFLEKILLDFGVQGSIKKVNYGPVVTLYEFEPAAGVKVSKIINLSEDIARNTSSESARISIIPGSNAIGIELPNTYRENVFIKEIISNSNFFRKEYKLPIALGKSISGVPIVGDLSAMPHLLIAGTTGSGKSVCINTVILSLIYKHSPDKCKFILIDPKMLELSTYEGIPHLLCPVITEAKKATSVLGWVVKEMESRYKLMTREGVRNIDGYNTKHKLPMPYIVVIVDEMSDLMHVAGKEIEGYIQKLSQMARASGIHIIMATQRPSVDVITGTIKANFPTRVSFQVSSKIDSRTILGEQGAEQLLGKGDMLYMSSANRIVRIHAPFVSDEEINKVNNFIRNQGEPDYIDEILDYSEDKEKFENNDTEYQDELYESALKIIRSEGKASTSFLQRKLQIGYNRAARIIDMMEESGVVSKANHVGKREVLK